MRQRLCRFVDCERELRYDLDIISANYANGQSCAADALAFYLSATCHALSGSVFLRELFLLRKTCTDC